MSHLTQRQLNTLELPEIKLVESRIRDIVEGHSQYLGSITDYILNLGGKRIRPLLVLLGSGIYRANLRARVDIAAAAELIHTASLLHDDVVDDADVRRNQPSVKKQWGNPSSVLAGDFLFAKAFSILSNYTDALAVMTEAIATMSEGELIQLHGHFDPDITPETYINSIAGKTASLLAASCQCGGLISTMPRTQVGALRDYGLHLGIAYQILDDIGDYVLGSALSGKPNGNDLKHGIITLPLLYVLANSSSRSRVQHLIQEGRTLKPEMLAAELSETQALERAAQVAYKHIQLAQGKLAGLPHTQATIIMNHMAEEFLERCKTMLYYPQEPQASGHALQAPSP